MIQKKSMDKRLGYFSFFMEKIKIQKEPVRVRINRMTFEIWKKYSKNKNAHNYLFQEQSLEMQYPIRNTTVT